MASEKHLYLTFGGGYTSAVPSLAEESWQTGIRLALVFGDVDDVGSLPNNWDPVAGTINNIGTNWTTTGNWTVDGPGLESFDPGAYLDDHAVPAIVAWLQTTGLFHQVVELDSVRLYPIGPTGHAVPAPPYAAGSPCTAAMTTAPHPHGAASGEPLPAQLSIVASFRTLQVGRRGRGRSYAPIMPASLVNDAVLTGTVNADVAGAYSTLLEDLAVVGAGATNPSISPIITGAPWTDYAVIKTVRVGNVWDTQRRRRKSASESFAQADVTIG